MALTLHPPHARASRMHFHQTQLCSTAVSAHVDLNEENDMSPVTADAVDGCG